METNERVTIVQRLAKFLNVGEQKDDQLIIKTEDSTVPDENVETLKKELGTATNVIKSLQAKDEARDAVSKAMTAISKAADAAAVDQAVSVAKSDISTILKEAELDADSTVAKFANGQVEGEIAEAAKARKADIEKSGMDEEEAEFRKALPKAMCDEYDKMSAEERKEMRDRFKKSDAGDDPVMKTLGEQEATIKKQGEEIAKMKHQEEVRKVRDEFADLAPFVDMEKFAENVVKLRGHDEDAANDLIESTQRLAKQLKGTGALLRPIGKNGDGDAGDAEQKLEKIAKDLQGADSELTDEAAFAKATEDNPELYQEYLNQSQG